MSIDKFISLIIICSRREVSFQEVELGLILGESFNHTFSLFSQASDDGEHTHMRISDTLSLLFHNCNIQLDESQSSPSPSQTSVTMNEELGTTSMLFDMFSSFLNNEFEFIKRVSRWRIAIWPTFKVIESHWMRLLTGVVQGRDFQIDELDVLAGLGFFFDDYSQVPEEVFKSGICQTVFSLFRPILKTLSLLLVFNNGLA